MWTDRIYCERFFIHFNAYFAVRFSQVVQKQTLGEVGN